MTNRPAVVERLSRLAADEVVRMVAEIEGRPEGKPASSTIWTIHRDELVAKLRRNKSVRFLVSPTHFHFPDTGPDGGGHLLTPVMLADRKLGGMTPAAGRELAARLAIELVRSFFRDTLESDEACAQVSMRQEVKKVARAMLGHLRSSLRECLNEEGNHDLD